MLHINDEFVQTDKMKLLSIIFQKIKPNRPIVLERKTYHSYL